MQGLLFTQDFLEEGIAETDAWRDLDDVTLAEFRDRLTEIFAAFPISSNPNEPTTERQLIDPILGALGWDHFLPQQAAGRRRSDVPDYLLFEDAEAATRANQEDTEVSRYRHGASILEAKRWQRPLDRGGEPDLFDDGVPSTQILRYLSRVEVASDRRIQWGILSNGRHWRLYFQGARSRSEEFLELDLPIIAGISGVERDLFSPTEDACAHQLKIFLVLFRREAFLPTHEGERTFHQLALDEGRLWEAGVAGDLSEVVFADVFPRVVRALANFDPNRETPLTTSYLEEVRVAALTLLYRILFVLYAEDRNLLPVRDSRYDDYALRRVRESVRDRIDANDVFSSSQGRYHSALNELFNAIHTGDESLGLPPYNGGLFDPNQHVLLERVTIPDSEFALIVDALSRRVEGDQRKWINFRDLSVQQLGSIYERLLEFAVAIDDDGNISIRPNVFARRTSGSYYTHDDLVSLIIERAVRPLLEELTVAFKRKSAELQSSHTRREARMAQLQRYDPASAFLDLKICDPAMGSGHFLVSLVDYLADATLEAVADAQAAVDWAPDDEPYRSPLIDRIETIRDRIIENAQSGGWVIDRELLDDRHIVRRMILKRVIYGVDKNPMAVELAKVALWLHTFTVGAPLSFLDHHLRCGDSLYGEWVGHAMRELSEHYALLINPYVQRARNAVAGMQRIEELTDADIAEVQTSLSAFDAVTADTRPLRRFLDFRHALRWRGVHDLTGRNVPRELVAILDGSFGDPFLVVAGDIPLLDETEDEPETGDMFGANNPEQLELAPTQRVERDTRLAAQTLLDEANAVAERERFLHWEVAFPGVWSNWESTDPQGGFDAVIGNPPWDRIKLQEVEWFSARRPEIAHANRASDRKRMIKTLRESNDPLWREYEIAREQAEKAKEVARRCGDYPLLSSGDINLYSLFVERGHRLIEREGLVGLLVPSGIASDLGASQFFREISTSGRLAALFDFENRRVFFPDVDSRFKFCTFIAGGVDRTFPNANCAFYLHSVEELNDPERQFNFSAEDFTRVNPNTGTAPVFRTRREADITTDIYTRIPVLVDRRGSAPIAVWPLRYFTMFHMTNDAGLFKTRAELEAEGFYLAEINCLRRGEEEYMPLYEGKMVQAFDHRAASVVVDPARLHRPGQPEPATPEQHADPTWCPTPQYWVAMQEIEEIEGLLWAVTFKEITAPTNVRTMIATAAPLVAFGNKVPLLLPNNETDISEYRTFAPLFLANFNCFAFDFVVRQKVHGQTINLFILEQFPLIPAEGYQRRFGQTAAADIVCREVLHLTYTAHDMEPFARDMSYEGPPFVWDEEDRRHRRARLDALFFHLYGIDRENAAYILDTFPIVKRQDEAEFGRYLTKDLILAYMNAVAAGDFDSLVSV